MLMSNHYHLVLETQDANLVAGMQWLQSTFANRFNRTVRDHGHVFQGRYKALLIEDGGSLLRVVNYIHLNPVGAGLLTVEGRKGRKGVIHIGSCQVKMYLPRTEILSVCDTAV